jgi:very-short-patch-repair endonuclease
MADRKSYPNVNLRAKELRKTPTSAEQILWAHLRNRNLCGLKFRRQHPIGPYIADFYCAQHRLIVELDDGVHASQAEQDRQRTEQLAAYGYRVLRFSNLAVEHDLEVVLGKITTACEASAGMRDDVRQVTGELPTDRTFQGHLDSGWIPG